MSEENCVKFGQLDKDTILMICKAQWKFFAESYEDDENIFLEYNASNQWGDRLFLSLPKRGIKRRSLKQMISHLLPRRFRELTDKLELNRGSAEAFFGGYIPFWRYTWQRRAESGIDICVSVPRKAEEYLQDPGGFIVISFERPILERAQVVIESNLERHVLKRGTERDKTMFELSYGASDIYILDAHHDTIICNDDLEHERDYTGQPWLSMDEKVFRAYRKTWGDGSNC